MNTITNGSTMDTARTGNIFQKVVILLLFTHQIVFSTPTELENAAIGAEKLPLTTRTIPRPIGTFALMGGAVAAQANAKKESNLQDTTATDWPTIESSNTSTTI